MYDFDSNGNRTRKFEAGTLTAYTYGESNELLTAGSDTFTYDHFLNMKTKVSGGNTTTYNWDFESNLTSIDFPNTSNDDTHEYDAMGRRMRSKLNGAANWTNFIWDEDAGTLLAEYTLISSTFALTSENTWGLGLISTNRAGTKRYFHFDGNGNTVALTDTSESVTDTYGYTESGQAVASLDSGTSTNPFRWQGMGGAYDDEAMGSLGGLVLQASQYFSPTVAVVITGHSRTPAPSKPCTDLIKNDLKIDENVLNLLECLRSAGKSASAIQKCLSKYGNKLTQEQWDKLRQYIACIMAADTDPGLSSGADKNACNPPNPKWALSCCYQKFLNCLFECSGKSANTWPLCIANCENKKGGFKECLAVHAFEEGSALNG